MPDNILAPLDGSSAAEAGLAWALNAAACWPAAIDLYRVVEPAEAGADGIMAGAEAYLRAHRDEIESDGLTVNVEIVSGPPAERILDRSSVADLTVMTYGTSRWLFGGALDLMFKKMTRPVVVVRAPAGHTRRDFDTRKILVPIDTAPYSRDALSEVQRIAHALGSSIILCHVVAPVGPHLDTATAPPGVRRVIEGLMDDARLFLSSVARDMGRNGATAETVVGMGEVPQQIARIAERSEVGMIAMATRGIDSLSRVLGSVAYGVLQIGRVPCLLVRPRNG